MLKPLILTIIVSIFFLLGILIPKFFHNQNKLILISTGLSFIIMIFLGLFDLIPEIIEILDPINNKKYLLLVIIFIILGIAILKLLDFFVPEHSHHHQDNETNTKEHNDHFFHIGMITAIALIIHNILEGISIYITGLNSLKIAIFMAITVGIHNLPLGMEISASMNISDNKKTTRFIINFLLVVSSSFGALILYILKTDLNFLVEGILLSLTLGMLIYIALFEIFHEVVENISKKEMKMGLIIGLIISIIIGIL